MLAERRIWKYYGDGSRSTYNIDTHAIKTFGGIDLDGDEAAELAQVCDELAEYVGDQKYAFSENCFVCMEGAPTAYPTAFPTGSPTALDNP